MIERLASLAAADAAAVRELAAAAASTDDVAPLSEQTLLRLDDASAPVQHLLLRSGAEVIAYAQLEQDGAAELVVAPAHRRRGVGRRMLDTLGHVSRTQLRIWAHGDLPGAEALAQRTGYERSRVLLQLGRSLSEELPDPVWPAAVTVRTFEVGRDEQAWLAVNGAAFAHHPEQGRWRLEDLVQREQQDWFDPAGFFLADRDGQVIGFHWTKVHVEQAPPVGEVYVVGVLPDAGGQGLGRALTLVGLHHLRASGLGSVMLYVDESNIAAMKTYERLGFTRWAADVMYSRKS